MTIYILLPLLKTLPKALGERKGEERTVFVVAVILALGSVMGALSVVKSFARWQKQLRRASKNIKFKRF